MVDLRDQISVGKHLPEWMVNWGERFLGLHALNVAHAKIEDAWDAGCRKNFFELACQYLNLQYDLTGLENIPSEGPCVIVSNHPHGMSDGLMFGDIAMKVREDIRIVVNEFLDCVRGMRPYEIKVDVYGGEQATRANLTSMREILRWLKEGHCILVFPSGSAATYSRQDKRVIDDPWQTNIASIIRKTGATVVPMHISGHTGALFQLVSMVAKEHRSSLLAREIKRDGRMRHTIHLGKAISPSVLKQLPSDEALSDHLRLRVMLQRYPGTPHGSRAVTREDILLLRQASSAGLPTASPSGSLRTGQTEAQSTLGKRPPAEELIAEMAGLPQDSLLYRSENGRFDVYIAEAAQIPLMMREIGIQRERTFRAVGEGTGTECDIDAYDSHYLHLIMWDNEAKCFAGAYRVGRVDRILEEQGEKGIYNAAYFSFGPAIRRILPQSLEMGRAFITPEYQKLPASLDTLWMGIGRFLNKHPEYRYLFGTVSISQDYSETSRSLILSYLKACCMNAELAHEVKAFTPPHEFGLYSEDERLLPSAVPDIQILNSIICDLEPGGKGIPVLLRQYLRLGGQMISFGIDRGFGNTLDCLVVIDLANTPERIVKRYRGKDYTPNYSPDGKLDKTP